MRTKFTRGNYHPQGVYFGMPFDEYISDWGLGSSDLINLLISPSNYYWWSSANPLRDGDRSTPALRYGRAIHKAVLEGTEAFQSEYAVKAPPPEPGILVSADQLKDKCRELGLKVSGTKTELIERIREAGDTTPIYDELVEEYRRKAGDRIMLDPDVYAEVQMASSIIKQNPYLKNAFEGGYPEVSVFFEHEGVPMRARFDYFKTRAVVDLKSIRNHLKLPFEKAVANAIARHDYAIQATSYLIARAAVAEFIKQGKVYGEKPPDWWLEEVVNEQNFCFIWVFYQAEGAPITRGVLFDANEEEFITSLQRISYAIDIYKQYLTEFDTELWIEAADIVQFANLDMPGWFGQ